MSTADSRQEIPAALLLVLTAWSLLAAQALLAPGLGRGAAVLISFAAVTALVLASRRRGAGPATGRAAGLAGVAAFAGFASYPLWILLIGAAGAALGLRPTPPPARPSDPLLLVATLGLAPVFEEVLYRERLLLALRSRIGAGLAVAISSLLFALPHLEPWSVLGTSLVGLALGALMLAGRSLALCIGLHAGLNLAAVVCGIPPVRWVLPEPLALLTGAGALGLGLLTARRARPAVIPSVQH
jgi:membrane protease YdiL (CAAX protease family)